jgi:hypothetical protein
MAWGEKEGTVRTISATLRMSMDGVVQAPDRPDEDTRDERGPGTDFELVDSLATSTGVIIATDQVC